MVANLISFISIPKKKKIVQRMHKKIRLLAQLEMNVTLENLVFKCTDQAPKVMATINEATSMETEDNIQMFLKELTHTMYGKSIY